MGKLPFVRDVANALKVPFFKPKETTFLYNTIVSTIKHRRQTGARRNDLIDMMMDAMSSELKDELALNEHSQDQFEKDSQLQHDKAGKANVFKTVEDEELAMVATAMNMLVAGYDTTAQTLSFLG